MERLIWHVVDELSSGYKVHVIGPVGCREHLPSRVDVDEVAASPLPWFLLSMSFAALKNAMLVRPVAVFAGSGLTAPGAWIAARLVGARCYVYLHGLDIDTEHLLYRLFWRPFIRRFDTIIANSGFTRSLAVGARVPAERIEILHPGVGLPTLEGAVERGAAFRSRFGLGESPVLLYVGRITARKGLLPFVRDVFPEIMRRFPDGRLVVIGDEPVKAVLRSDAGERQRCEQSLLQNGLQDSAMFLGEISDDDLLSSAYFAANVAIFPVQFRSNDNEGFGMVAIEAAAHGCPTVAYNVGGVSDAVADGVSGSLVGKDDALGFAEAVGHWLGDDSKAADENSCRGFAAMFEWSRFGDSLRELLARR